MLFKVERRPHCNRPLFIRCKCCGKFRHSKYLVKKLKWGFKFSKGEVRKVPRVSKINFACSKRCADALTLQMM